MEGLEFLVGEKGEEIKRIYTLLEQAERAKSTSEAADYLREAKEVMGASAQKELYDPKVVEEVVAEIFLRKVEITKPRRELERDLEKVIFTNNEVFNGLIETERGMKERCLRKVGGAGYAQIESILDALGRGAFEPGFMDRYERLREVIGENGRGRERKPIMMSLNGEKTGKTSDELFYGMMIKNMSGHLKAGKFDLKEESKCQALIFDYHKLREKYEEGTGQVLKLRLSGKLVVLVDEIFYAELAEHLSKLSRKVEAGLQAEKLIDYRDKLLGKGQDFLYEQAEKAGEQYKVKGGEEGRREEKEKQKERFDLFAAAYIRFTSNFSEVLEETKEEAEEEMKGLRKKYFSPTQEAGENKEGIGSRIS